MTVVADAMTSVLMEVVKTETTAIVEAILSNPDALAALRSALGAEGTHTNLLAYTTATLAKRTGTSPRAVAAAIRRGELRAGRRGAGSRAPYIIAVADAEKWAEGRAPSTDAREGRRAQARRAARPRTNAQDRPLKAALEALSFGR